MTTVVAPCSAGHGTGGQGQVARAKAPRTGKVISLLLSWRYFDVVVHLAAVSVIAATWLYTEDVPLTLRVGGWIAGLTYLGLMAFEMKRAPTRVSPLSFYFLWYSIGAGIAALSIARRVADHDSIRLGAAVVRPSDLGWGYIMFLTGSVAFHFGVQILRPLKERTSIPAPLSRDGSRRYPVTLGIVWASGIVMRLVGDPNTPAGAMLSILTWASCAALCAYALSTSLTKPRVSWILLIVGCLIELACNLQSFSKAYMMYSFVPIVWACVYFRRYRAWLLPVIGGLASFYFWIVAPVVGNARNEGVLESDDSYAARLLRHYADYSLAESNLSEEVTKFFERQFDAIPAGFIHGEVEQFGLRYGDTFDYLAYAFIPRLIWPEKPAVSRGAWFTVYLGGALTEEDARTSTGLSAAGELYWNFGWWAVAAGLAVIGLSVGLLWRIAGLLPFSDPLRMLLYVSTVILVVDNGQAGVMFVGIVHRVLVLGSLIWFWDQRCAVISRRRAAATSFPRRRLAIEPSGRMA